ncbi:MAG: carboxypeptidase regulatory-like domain-containing protein, partial [Gemmatimonadaceae bacterium]|nr:carboxypeptidase regulatory-like domain-containing protein [Gemmatimonadaceae bacterium]
MLHGVLQRALLAVLVPAAVQAQIIRGLLLRDDGVTGAEGVIVVVRGVGADSILTRSLSNGAGRFSLTLRPGRVKLTALRIGQRPYEIGEVTLAPFDTQSVRVILPHTPIVLPTVTTTARATCRLSGAEGAAVATAYEEARKAILSTTLSAEDGPPIARYATFTQERSVGNRDQSSKARTFSEGPSRSPFESLSPEELSENGYQLSRQSETSY